MNDLVFESNNPDLWDNVRTRVDSYCFDLYKRGALKGRDTAEAYFVKCDAELNPIEVREAGQLICEVGLAPLAPAEFILIRITQSAAAHSCYCYRPDNKKELPIRRKSIWLLEIGLIRIVDLTFGSN